LKRFFTPLLVFNLGILVSFRSYRYGHLWQPNTGQSVTSEGRQ
jgi:hypothetical protein